MKSATKFYKFNVTKQAVDAFERAFLNEEEEWVELERRYEELRDKNRGEGLTKTEGKEVRDLISKFNDRGKEYNSLK